MIDAAEHGARIARLQGSLAGRGLRGALLLHAVDVLYLAGTRQNGALWLPARGAPLLLVRRSVARARAEAAVADVRPFPPSRELAGLLGAAGEVGFALDVVPAATAEWWRGKLGGAELVDVSPLLREQRSVKSPAEIALQRAAAARLCGVFAEVPSFLRAGMTEVDVAAEFEYRLRRAGNLGSPRLRAYNTEFSGGVVVGGDSATAPGYFDGAVVGRGLDPSYPLGASERRIAPGEPVLLDYTLVYGGYVVDMTRMAVVGEWAPALSTALDVARAIQDEVAANLRPGTTGSALWERARARAEAAGLGASFMGPAGEQVRFVGHGVGLELDELPVLAPGFDAPLVAGQTVAIEPKFVLPGLGAVGVENTFAVTGAGGERITAFPDDVLRARGA